MNVASVRICLTNFSNSKLSEVHSDLFVQMKKQWKFLSTSCRLENTIGISRSRSYLENQATLGCKVLHIAFTRTSTVSCH